MSVDRAAPGGGRDWLDPALAIGRRVDSLVSSMTLEEKISQMVNGAQAIERLGVPAYDWWNECLHGVGRAGVATVFPQAIGLAAAWNVDLMHRIATTISDEARAKHHQALRAGIRQIYAGLTFWSPNVNIFRDPRWGRGQETYGEDPHLTARLGVAFVKGLQGDDPRYLKLVATAKHYAVHSGPEPDRHHFDARVGERELRETYLPAFEALVKEGGVVSVMGAYNRTNGEPCCASPTLIQKILREEWGFDGYFVSDCWAIDDIFEGHKVARTAAEASALAVKAGCDLECGCAYPSLREAVEQGLIDEATIDNALRRLFTARIRLGMFDPPDLVPYARIPIEVNDGPAHRGLALQAARESIVLLKNEAGALPLRKDLESVAVIGPNADAPLALLGNYNGTPSRAITPLEGIRKKLSPETKLYHARGCELAVDAPPLVAVPSSCLRPADAGAEQHGLTGEYYGNPDFDRSAAFSRVDPIVDFTWRGRTDSFAVRWTGYLVPPVSGRYKLGVDGATSYRLWLDGRELVAYAGIHHPVVKTADVELEAGRLHRIQLDYANRGLDPQAHLIWSVPGADYAAEALEVAGKAEVVVVVLGLTAGLEGEEMPVRIEGFAGGDRTDIGLPRSQEELLKRVCALGKPVVLVLLNGSAIAITWAAEHVPAIVEAWYPGQAGGDAIADVLFGDYNPAGRLPVTFYRSLDQLPPFEDYAMAGRTYRYLTAEPLYPFGHGLSYTRFEYANLRVDPEVSADGQIDVRFDVRNVGARAGDEVVQLYVSYPESRVPRPARELKGFRRVSLGPGEARSITLRVPASQLAYYGPGGWVVEPGRVAVEVGGSSRDVRLVGEAKVVGS